MKKDSIIFCPESSRNKSTSDQSPLTGRTLSERSSLEARKLLPFPEALRLLALPLVLEQETGFDILHVAGVRGREEQIRTAVRFQAGCEVSVIPIAEEELEQEIFKAYKGDVTILNCLPAAGERKNAPLASEQNSLLLAYDRGKGDAVVGLAALIDYAVAHGISDIHITPLVEGVRIRARKNGELLEREELVGDSVFHREVVNRLKVLVQAAVTPITKPVDGSFFAGARNRPVRVRVSIMPSVHGENVVLRILNNGRIEQLNELGYGRELVTQLTRFCRKRAGLMLVCGSTGSGKTTTLYALAENIAHQNRLVHTLEDPIEKALDSLVQTEIDHSRGVSYRECFPALLRQDPDCILLGELRDRESAQAIVQAALTGHITLSSVHGGSIAAVMERFRQFSIQIEEFQSALGGILCQSLVPLLCSACKVMDLEATRQQRAKVCKAVGCAQCDYTGYRGRLPVAEAFFPDGNWICTTGSFSSDELAASGWYCSMKNRLESLLKQSKIDSVTFEVFRNE